MENKLMIGTWNVRGECSDHKVQEINDALLESKLDMVCLQETNLRSGISFTDNYQWFNSGHCNHESGVSFLVLKTSKLTVNDHKFISEYLSVIHVELDCLENEIIVACVLVPNEENMRDIVFNKLLEILTPNYMKKPIIILGDMKAEIGKFNIKDEDKVYVGKLLFHFHSNKMGNLLVELAKSLKLDIVSTFGPYEEIRNVTTMHKLDICQSYQIDHILSNQYPDICVRRNCCIWKHTVETDHKLLIADVFVNCFNQDMVNLKSNYFHNEEKINSLFSRRDNSVNTLKRKFLDESKPKKKFKSDISDQLSLARSKLQQIQIKNSETEESTNDNETKIINCKDETFLNKPNLSKNTDEETVDTIVNSGIKFRDSYETEDSNINAKKKKTVIKALTIKMKKVNDNYLKLKNPIKIMNEVDEIVNEVSSTETQIMKQVLRPTQNKPGCSKSSNTIKQKKGIDHLLLHGIRKPENLSGPSITTKVDKTNKIWENFVLSIRTEPKPKVNSKKKEEMTPSLTDLEENDKRDSEVIEMTSSIQKIKHIFFWKIGYVKNLHLAINYENLELVDREMFNLNLDIVCMIVKDVEKVQFTSNYHWTVCNNFGKTIVFLISHHTSLTITNTQVFTENGVFLITLEHNDFVITLYGVLISSSANKVTTLRTFQFLTNKMENDKFPILMGSFKAFIGEDSVIRNDEIIGTNLYDGQSNHAGKLLAKLARENKLKIYSTFIRKNINIKNHGDHMLTFNSKHKLIDNCLNENSILLETSVMCGNLLWKNKYSGGSNDKSASLLNYILLDKTNSLLENDIDKLLVKSNSDILCCFLNNLNPNFNFTSYQMYNSIKSLFAYILTEKQQVHIMYHKLSENYLLLKLKFENLPVVLNVGVVYMQNHKHVNFQQITKEFFKNKNNSDEIYILTFEFDVSYNKIEWRNIKLWKDFEYYEIRGEERKLMAIKKHSVYEVDVIRDAGVFTMCSVYNKRMKSDIDETLQCGTLFIESLSSQEQLKQLDTLLNNLQINLVCVHSNDMIFITKTDNYNWYQYITKQHSHALLIHKNTNFKSIRKLPSTDFNNSILLNYKQIDLKIISVYIPEGSHFQIAYNELHSLLKETKGSKIVFGKLNTYVSDNSGTKFSQLANFFEMNKLKVWTTMFNLENTTSYMCSDDSFDVHSCYTTSLTFNDVDVKLQIGVIKLNKLISSNKNVDADVECVREIVSPINNFPHMFDTRIIKMKNSQRPSYPKAFVLKVGCWKADYKVLDKFLVEVERLGQADNFDILCILTDKNEFVCKKSEHFVWYFDKFSNTILLVRRNKSNLFVSKYITLSKTIAVLQIVYNNRIFTIICVYVNKTLPKFIKHETFVILQRFFDSRFYDSVVLVGEFCIEVYEHIETLGKLSKLNIQVDMLKNKKNIQYQLMTSFSKFLRNYSILFIPTTGCFDLMVTSFRVNDFRGLQVLKEIDLTWSFSSWNVGDLNLSRHCKNLENVLHSSQVVCLQTNNKLTQDTILQSQHFLWHYSDRSSVIFLTKKCIARVNYFAVSEKLSYITYYSNDVNVGYTFFGVNCKTDDDLTDVLTDLEQTMNTLSHPGPVFILGETNAIIGRLYIGDKFTNYVGNKLFNTRTNVNGASLVDFCNRNEFYMQTTLLRNLSLSDICLDSSQHTKHVMTGRMSNAYVQMIENVPYLLPKITTNSLIKVTICSSQLKKLRCLPDSLYNIKSITAIDDVATVTVKNNKTELITVVDDGNDDSDVEIIPVDKKKDADVITIDLIDDDEENDKNTVNNDNEKGLITDDDDDDVEIIAVDKKKDADTITIDLVDNDEDCNKNTVVDLNINENESVDFELDVNEESLSRASEDEFFKKQVPRDDYEDVEKMFDFYYAFYHYEQFYEDSFNTQLDILDILIWDTTHLQCSFDCKIIEQVLIKLKVCFCVLLTNPDVIYQHMKFHLFDWCQCKSSNIVVLVRRDCKYSIVDNDLVQDGLFKITLKSFETKQSFVFIISRPKLSEVNNFYILHNYLTSYKFDCKHDEQNLFAVDVDYDKGNNIEPLEECTDNSGKWSKFKRKIKKNNKTYSEYAVNGNYRLFYKNKEDKNYVDKLNIIEDFNDYNLTLITARDVRSSQCVQQQNYGNERVQNFPEYFFSAEYNRDRRNSVSQKYYSRYSWNTSFSRYQHDLDELSRDRMDKYLTVNDICVACISSHSSRALDTNYTQSYNYLWRHSENTSLMFMIQKTDRVSLETYRQCTENISYVKIRINGDSTQYDSRYIVGLELPYGQDLTKILQDLDRIISSLYDYYPIVILANFNVIFHKTLKPVQYNVFVKNLSSMLKFIYKFRFQVCEKKMDDKEEIYFLFNNYRNYNMNSFLRIENMEIIDSNDQEPQLNSFAFKEERKKLRHNIGNECMSLGVWKLEDYNFTTLDNLDEVLNENNILVVNIILEQGFRSSVEQICEHYTVLSNDLMLVLLHRSLSILEHEQLFDMFLVQCASNDKVYGFICVNVKQVSILNLEMAVEKLRNVKNMDVIHIMGDFNAAINIHTRDGSNCDVIGDKCYDEETNRNGYQLVQFAQDFHFIILNCFFPKKLVNVNFNLKSKPCYVLGFGTNKCTKHRYEPLELLYFENISKSNYLLKVRINDIITEKIH